jgi:hypothetical protein
MVDLRGSRLAVILSICAIGAGCSKHRERSLSYRVELGQPTGAATFADVGSQVLLAAATTYPEPTEIAEPPPVSLTAGDGTGLRLIRYTARVAVHGPLAFTELRLSFQNPEDRVLEGRFQLTLPEGAAISRLAMRTSAGWQEAEVVELGKARRVYEDFLHRAQDPALLEREAGNQFRARIFPIDARATKDIIVSFSAELASPTEDYRLPLRGLPQIDSLDVAAVVGGKWTRLSKKGWVPDVDFVAPRTGAARALRAGGLFAAYVTPAGTGKRARLDAMTIAFDTSASRTPGYAGSVDDLVATIAALPGDPEIALFVFDQEIAPIYRGKASKLGERERRLLRARRPLGASDLGLALRTAAAIGHPRVVVVGDAVATAGTREVSELVALARGLEGIDRIDVVVRGGIRDRDAARALTAAGGAVLDGDRMTPAEVAASLGEEVASGVAVSAAGARWVYPDRLDGVLAGQTRVIYGDLGDAKALALSVGGAVQRPAAAAAPAVLLRRAVASAEIARLEAQLAAMGADAGDRREAMRERIVDVSVRSRVLSRFTGLLVLETEEDYRRFDIERTALADVLTIDESGRVVAVSRSGSELVMVEPTAPPIENEEGEKDYKESGKREAGEDEAVDEEVMGGSAPALEPPPAPRPSPEPERVAETETATAPSPAVGSADPGQSVDGDDGSPGPAEERVEPEQTGPPPIAGTFATVRAQLDAKKLDDALVTALAWHREKPGDVMALVALGEALEAAGHQRLAARAYGSIIDLFPSRADLRRYAGMRLARLAAGVELATDSFAAAVASRPDHLTGHRLLAYAHARAGRYDQAMSALEAGLDQRYPPGRFAGGTRVLAEDLAIVGAAWIAARPAVAAAVRRRLAKRKLEPAGPTVRFVLSWETDANDVDFHIHDGRGGHASFRQKTLASGGELYADITNGYGPECFAISGKPAAAPYRLRAHYYSRGPMGYGMGQLEVLEWDGQSLSIEARPFVVMNDGAYLELGSWSP